MAVKLVEIEGIGPLRIYKRRNQRYIRLSLTDKGEARVSMPFWATYQSGIDFALARRDWIKQQPRRNILLTNGMRVGKSRRLSIVSCQTSRISTKFLNNQVEVSYPLDLDQAHHKVQTAVRRAARKSLQIEAEKLLSIRVNQLSLKHKLKFNNLRFRYLTSRWGSCSRHLDLTFNIGLMHLPWDLIDYVILHELAHTKVLSHGPRFWAEMERLIPDCKERRKQIRAHKPALAV